MGPRGAGGPDVLLVGHMDTAFTTGPWPSVRSRSRRHRARPRRLGHESRPAGGFFATRALQDRVRRLPGPSPTCATRMRRRVGRSLASSATWHRRTTPRWCSRSSRERRHRGARAKGTRTSIAIEGKAHAGVESEKGRNAILQAAHIDPGAGGARRPLAGVTSNVGGHGRAERGRWSDCTSISVARVGGARGGGGGGATCADPAVPDVRITDRRSRLASADGEG